MEKERKDIKERKEKEQRIKNSIKKYLDNEVKKIVNENLSKEDFSFRIKQIVNISQSIRKGEMYIKTQNNNIELYTKICSNCGHDDPIGENIYCYAEWYCEDCNA